MPFQFRQVHLHTQTIDPRQGKICPSTALSVCCRDNVITESEVGFSHIPDTQGYLCKTLIHRGNIADLRSRHPLITREAVHEVDLDAKKSDEYGGKHEHCDKLRTI